MALASTSTAPTPSVPQETNCMPVTNFIYLCVRKDEPRCLSDWYVLEPDCLGSSIPALEKHDFLADCESDDSNFKSKLSVRRGGNLDIKFPSAYGCVAVESSLYIIGGWEYDFGPPSKRVFVFEISTNKWYETESMLAPRVHPIVVLYKGKSIFVFGGATLDYDFQNECYRSPQYCNLIPWAEYMNIDKTPPKWNPIDDVPDELLLNGYGNSEIYGHTVIDSVIILWTRARFFLFNPGATDTAARWTSFPISPLLLEPGHDMLSTKVTVMDGIFYWWCGDSIFAYDLVGNVAFSERLFRIDIETGFKFHLCPTPKTQQFLFSSATNELCLIWHHSNNGDKLLIVCGKVVLEKSMNHEGGISLSATVNEFEYFCLDGLYISDCVGMANVIGDNSPPVSNPVGVLKKLSWTMYKQTIKERKTQWAVDGSNLPAQVFILDSNEVTTAPSSEDSEEGVDTFDSHPEKHGKEGVDTLDTLSKKHEKEGVDTLDTHPKKHEKDGSSTLLEDLEFHKQNFLKPRDLRKYQHTLDAHLKKHKKDGLSTLECLKLEDLLIPMGLKKAIIGKLKEEDNFLAIKAS